MRPLLTQDQLIGSIVLITMVVGVNIFVRIVPQHALRPQAVAESGVEETLATSTKVSLHPFDPNTADSLTLIQLGLRPWQVSNMMRYRAKDGRFRTPEDFSRLYGLTDSAYQTLRPYIAIDTMPFHRERLARQVRDSLRRDSVRAHYKALRDSAHRADNLRRDSLRTAYPKREKRDTVLELNTADTASLQLIRGIGRYMAANIVHYRNQLGGFVSVEQLHDEALSRTYRLADSILLHFTVEPDSVHPIPVNLSSMETLRRHPYINFEQADAIYTLRRRMIRLRSIHDLEQLDCLSPNDLLRLTPYLDFSE